MELLTPTIGGLSQSINVIVHKKKLSSQESTITENITLVTNYACFTKINIWFSLEPSSRIYRSVSRKTIVSRYRSILFFYPGE